MKTDHSHVLGMFYPVMMLMSGMLGFGLGKESWALICFACVPVAIGLAAWFVNERDYGEGYIWFPFENRDWFCYYQFSPSEKYLWLMPDMYATKLTPEECGNGDKETKDGR